MRTIINFFTTVTGLELSFVLLFMVVIDIGFAAVAARSLLSSSLRKGAIIKIGYALIPALMTWGERGLDVIDTTTTQGQVLVMTVISVYFILIFIAELVSIAGYYKTINPAATNLLARLADYFAPAEIKNKMEKLGIDELLDQTGNPVSAEKKENGEKHD